MVVHACDLRTYKIGTGGSGVQNHFQLHRKLKAKLGYMRPWLKTTTKKKVYNHICSRIVYYRQNLMNLNVHHNRCVVKSVMKQAKVNGVHDCAQCMHIYVGVCTTAHTCRRHWMSFSITLCLIPLRQGLSLTLEQGCQPARPHPSVSTIHPMAL